MAFVSQTEPMKSPYERQLQAGFGTLKFDDRLEAIFLQRHRTNIVGFLRVSLVLGVLFVAVQMLLDYLYLPLDFSRWSLGLGGALMIPVLLLALVISSRPERPALFSIGAVLVSLVLGASFIYLEKLAVEAGMPSRFAGFIAVTFYMYYLLGLLFWQALFTGLLLSGAFLAMGLFGELPAASFAYDGLYLGFSNVIGVLGLYTLERARRLDFLREGALDFSAGHDGLTGLQNRESFDRKFDLAWRVARREKKAISLMMIDIDYFKNYNDVYGHQAGDQCLQRVAKALDVTARRPLDFIGRYGGEEFVVFLSDAVEKHAIDAAENIRSQIEALGIPHSNSKAAPVVTVSVGLAHLSAAETERSKQGLMQLADEALYRAKDRGRNQVVRSEGEDKLIQTGLFRKDVGRSP